MPTIVLQHVTKRYEPGSESPLNRFVFGGTPPVPERESNTVLPDKRENMLALNRLSLTIRDGETLSVVGPSGCGKTTLLKIIAGLMHPDEGDVLYDATPVRDIPPDERGIGMVFQNYALFPHLEARDNIGFFDLIHRHPERIPERIQNIVKVMGVEIEHLLSRKPPTLSGGEKQRIAIARCLARDPKIFLFDEPLSNLDAKLRTETRIQLKRLLRHYQITSVYVTHDQTEAIALGDRIAIMRDGKIEQVGTYQALYETPLNAFVAQFFGTPPMNLFAGHVQDRQWYGAGFSIGPIRPALLNGQAVLLGVRPEAIKLVSEGITAEIESVIPVFSDRKQLLTLRLSGQRCLTSMPLDVSIAKKGKVQIEFSTDHLYLFDQKTGARIG